jgi:hypothetical protein
MTEEHLTLGRTLGVDAERVHVRHKLVELEGITRDEFHGLVGKLEGTEYRLSMYPPGTPLRLCNGNDDTFEAMFWLYQHGYDAETVLALVNDYDCDLTQYVWDHLVKGRDLRHVSQKNLDGVLRKTYGKVGERLQDADTGLVAKIAAQLGLPHDDSEAPV